MALKFLHRFHSYQQLYLTDCGQTCIRMIARHYGLDIDYKYICSKADSDRQGLAVSELVSVLNLLNFDAFAVNIDLTKFEKMPLPAILFMNGNHYAVLYKINLKKGIFYLADPASGKVKLNKKDFLKRFYCLDETKGVAIVTAPKDDFTCKGYPKDKVFKNMASYFWTSLQGNLKKIYCVILLLLLILAADIALPFLFKSSIDSGIGDKNIALIWLLAASQVAIFIGGYCANSVTELILTKLGLKIGIQMVNQYLVKLLSLPMNYYARHSPSDLVQRIDDQNRLKNFLISMPSLTTLTILNLVIFSGVLLWFSPLIFIAYMGLSCVNIGWMTLFLRYRKEIDYPLAGKTAENRNHLYELINGIEEIKASQAHTARVKVWKDVQNHINKLTLKATHIKILQNGGNQLLIRMRDALISGLCAVMVVQNDITIGGMMTISYIVGYLAEPLSNIITSINTIQDSTMAYRRIDGVMNHPIKAIATTRIDTIKSWKLNNIHFKYPGAASGFVLKECNLDIPIGKSIAIVGESGCGKSTLLKLLYASFQPSSGVISVNGYPFDEIDEDSYTSKLGLVMQAGTIYSSSIIENIGFSDSEPNLEKAIKAAKLACIDDFIESLPMKYQTKIGQSGIQLSGGQSQRILIARALYREPAVLILDEATSSLDAVTEAKIMDNIFKACRGKTLIIAAHRLSTIRNSDKIVVLSNGRISEEGTHEELLKLEGKYSELVHNQIGERIHL